VFRRFGTRAGIFKALMEDEEQSFQKRVLFGPPPLGPGAEPLDRLIAYGRARIAFMIEHREITRAGLDGRQSVPTGSAASLSRMHIRMLLGQIRLGSADLDVLAVQLSGALDGPLLLYMSASDLTEPALQTEQRTAQGWQDLVQRVCRP
jgi:AcrR family transcriptional regulator